VPGLLPVTVSERFGLKGVRGTYMFKSPPPILTDYFSVGGRLRGRSMPVFVVSVFLDWLVLSFWRMCMQRRITMKLSSSVAE
jgi:hypothetical protein